jgi:flagellar basal body-associated protein FliL
MADSVAVAAPAGDATEKKSRRLVVIAAVVLVVVAGAFGTKTFLGAGSSDAATTADPAPEEGAVVSVAQMTASLAGGAPSDAGGGASHYARIEFAAVLDANADQTTVEARFPLLKDGALSVLMGFGADELRTVAGADRLREALTAKAHEIYPDGDVVRIVLTELLIQ